MRQLRADDPARGCSALPGAIRGAVLGRLSVYARLVPIYPIFNERCATYVRTAPSLCQLHPNCATFTRTGHGETNSLAGLAR